MSEKAIAALGKLVPAPSTKNYQFYQAHYELIRDEITRLQSEVERLRGRCGELEDAVGVLRYRVINSMNDKRAAARNWPDAGVDEMLGRSASEDQEVLTATDYAQRLRQQADEAKKAGG